jgi:hypothetical protein
MNFTDKKLFLYNTLFLGNRKFLEETLEGEIKSFFEDPFGENKKTIFYKLSSLQIKVDEIRNIKNFINQTFDGVKIILISSFIWSNEVQNALLKVLEDTPKVFASFHKLPLISHADPFDRLIIWQAISNNMILISKDKHFKEYNTFGLKTLW